MLGYLKDLLTGSNEGKEEIVDNVPHEKKVQIATCALCIELANVDDEFTDEERGHIFETMKKIFGLDEKYINELIELSEEQIKHSVSLYEFTDIINKNFSKDEKYEILKNLWKLVYVDESLHSHEEYFLRKISGNLHMEHREMINAKMEVKKELNI